MLNKINDLNNRTVTGTSKDIITDLDILKIKCKPCFFTDLDIMKNQQIIADMLATCELQRDDCIGLAANQIGIHKRIICLLPGGSSAAVDTNYIVMVNPRIVYLRTYGIRKYEESCLSYPETMGPNGEMHTIRRYKRVKVFYQNVYGGRDQRVFKPFDSVVAQHELDHLDGVIYP